MESEIIPTWGQYTKRKLIYATRDFVDFEIVEHMRGLPRDRVHVFAKSVEFNGDGLYAVLDRSKDESDESLIARAIKRFDEFVEKRRAAAT